MMRAFQPEESQLTGMLAAPGRPGAGQFFISSVLRAVDDHLKRWRLAHEPRGGPDADQAEAERIVRGRRSGGRRRTDRRRRVRGRAAERREDQGEQP